MNLQDLIFDDMALARDLDVRLLSTDADGGKTYRAAFTIRLTPAMDRALADRAAQRGFRHANALRRIVKFGFKICFGDDDTPLAPAHIRQARAESRPPQ
jgi:hypothetical protein